MSVKKKDDLLMSIERQVESDYPHVYNEYIESGESNIEEYLKDNEEYSVIEEISKDISYDFGKGPRLSDHGMEEFDDGVEILESDMPGVYTRDSLYNDYKESDCATPGQFMKSLLEDEGYDESTIDRLGTVGSGWGIEDDNDEEFDEDEFEDDEFLFDDDDDDLDY